MKQREIRTLKSSSSCVCVWSLINKSNPKSKYQQGFEAASIASSYIHTIAIEATRCCNLQSSSGPSPNEREDRAEQIHSQHDIPSANSFEVEPYTQISCITTNRRTKLQNILPNNQSLQINLCLESNSIKSEKWFQPAVILPEIISAGFFTSASPCDWLITDYRLHHKQRRTWKCKNQEIIKTWKMIL